MSKTAVSLLVSHEQKVIESFEINSGGKISIRFLSVRERIERCSSPFAVIALLAERPEATCLFLLVAIFTISMAGGLFLSTWKIKEETQKAFNNSSGGFNAVLGARGSKLQLILMLFHLEASPGNLSWEQYELIANQRGERSVPNRRRRQLSWLSSVGTLPELFLNHEWKKGRKYEVRQGGRPLHRQCKGSIGGDLQPVNRVVRRQ